MEIKLGRRWATMTLDSGLWVDNLGFIQCSFVGLLVCWFVGLLVCWFVGVLVCWCVGLLLKDNNKIEEV